MQTTNLEALVLQHLLDGNLAVLTSLLVGQHLCGKDDTKATVPYYFTVGVADRELLARLSALRLNGHYAGRVICCLGS